MSTCRWFNMYDCMNHVWYFASDVLHDYCMESNIHDCFSYLHFSELMKMWSVCQWLIGMLMTAQTTVNHTGEKIPLTTNAMGLQFMIKSCDSYHKFRNIFITNCCDPVVTEVAWRFQTRSRPMGSRLIPLTRHRRSVDMIMTALEWLCRYEKHPSLSQSIT